MMTPGMMDNALRPRRIRRGSLGEVGEQIRGGDPPDRRDFRRVGTNIAKPFANQDVIELVFDEPVVEPRKIEKLGRPYQLAPVDAELAPQGSLAGVDDRFARPRVATTCV